jgi:predicted nucleic acid-binding protein
MRYVDTNIFIRYLTQDDPNKSAACLAFFNDVRDEKVEATTCEAVISEVVFVLASRVSYQLPRPDIRARLTPVLSLRGLKLSHRSVYLRALDLYATHSTLDFEDALCVAHMERSGNGDIESYDRDFDRVPGVTRHEPPLPPSGAPTNGTSDSKPS